MINTTEQIWHMKTNYSLLKLIQSYQNQSLMRSSCLSVGSTAWGHWCHCLGWTAFLKMGPDTMSDTSPRVKCFWLLKQTKYSAIIKFLVLKWRPSMKSVHHKFFFTILTRIYKIEIEGIKFRKHNRNWIQVYW